VPKDTFFNLPEEKRALICDVALDEFAEYPYDQTSINRIVAKSGIAKGSFYQYFGDKKDLFLYLTELIAKEKINYLSPVILNPEEHDIFTVVRELFLSGIQFAREHPRYDAIGKKILSNKDAPIYKELRANNQPSSSAVFERLLERAAVKGEIKADTDIKMLAYLLTAMSTTIIEYSIRANPDATYEAMNQGVDLFIDILRDGIGNNNLEILKETNPDLITTS
jgi:AcrR family transcriptional regulator